MGKLEDRKQQIKRFHTLLKVKGIDNLTKQSILAAYGVESSKNMSAEELREMNDYIQFNVNVTEEEQEMDRWRKAAIKAVSANLELEGNWGKGCEYAKAVAARAAGCDSFNKIPKQKLIAIYNAFRNKAKITRKVQGKREPELLD